MIEEFYRRLHESISESEGPVYRYYSEEYAYSYMYACMKKINYRLFGQRQKKVVVCGPKSIGVYSAIYAVILSGNIWVPVAPGYPVSRLLEMLDVLGPDLILYDGEFPPELRGFAADRQARVLDIQEMITGNDGIEFGSFAFKEDELAYIMFTSGSTGLPKGVPMTHRNYINFIRNVMEILPFKKGEVFSDYHDFSFDISIFYLFCAPLSGGVLAPVRKEEEKIYPVEHFQKNGVSVWSSVPSVLARIQKLRPREKISNCFRLLFICGEPFRLDLLRYCFENLNAEKVYNFYGLTETGVENFYHECGREDLCLYAHKGFVPIGLPLKGNAVMLTGAHELLLSGCQITPGYLGGREASRFELISGVRWYHTGDVVEEYEGVYFCKGRLDTQVKLSGYRIELMDIEVQIRRYPGIQEAVCFLDDRADSKSLVCACELREGAVIEPRDIKAHTGDFLPEYMVPKKVCFMPQMPRNTNGKLDRKTIKEMYYQGALR